MVTIKSKKMNVQASGDYDNIRLLGNAEFDGQCMTYLSGSVYKIESGGIERHVGNFNSNANLQITLNDKDDSQMLVEIADAVKAFQKEMCVELENSVGNE